MTDTSTGANAPFSKPDPRLGVGSTHAGFTVTAVEPIPELGGTAYVFSHPATGARAMWIAVPDHNKSFAIAFKTPPADDTGVFHILEHSVLCGSDRFPVKEPFVNLLKTSMQTFLNALTFPDKTMYPVASTNVADLENLMDVYLDAVLHPAIYHRKRIFEQEGWHLEVADDGGLSYNGVVLNEMKGAMSDPDDVLFHALYRALFPQTPYRYESGGDPRAIPTLTYEEFLRTHARHYDLSNSYTILYGDLDVDRELAFVDERFRDATRRDAGEPNPLPLQPAVRAGLSRVTMATTPQNASVAAGYVIGTYADRERVLATSILLDAIAGSNEAPLKRAMLDSGLADDFDAILLDGTQQPLVAFQLRGSKPEVADRFRELLEQTCADLARNGIGRDRLEASLAQAEFNLREGDWGSYADGVAISMVALSSWLYDDGRPVDYLRYEDAIASMRSGLDNGYFERLLGSLVCESSHSAEVELVPLADGAASEEARELAQLRDEMGPEQIQGIRDEVAALRSEQEAPDSPEALATLPRLHLSDIEDTPEVTPASRVDAPLPCVFHDLPTHRIVYAYHYFDLRRVAFEDLPYVALLTDFLGKLDTRDHTASELDTLVERSLGNLSFFCETYSEHDDLGSAVPKLVVGASSLSENVDALATLPAEVWGTTSFADTDRMLAMLQQRRIELEQYFQSSGHAAAAARLASHHSSAALVSDSLGAGVGYYLFVKELITDWGERKGDVSKRLAELARAIFTSDDVLVSLTCSCDDMERFWAAGGSLGLSPAVEGAAQRLLIPEPVTRDEAFVIPSDVCFCAEGMSGVRNEDQVGAWQVASRALSLDYLWNEVRVKGGAYGVGFRHALNGLPAFWSYRDPAIDPTLARFEGAGPWLRSWDGGEDELEGYVVSCVAAHDSPVKPRALARQQDGDLISLRPEGWRDRVREQILDVSADSLRDLAPQVEGLASNRDVVVFGPREAIDSSAVDFEVVTLQDEGERD